MSDEQYVDFVANNKNKSFTQIYPEDLRNKIIQELGTIKSNPRKGNRAYNEFYVSKPVVMGVFAYNVDTKDKIVNPIEFLSRSYVTKGEKRDANKHFEVLPTAKRTEFLKKHALNDDMPFFIFGD